MTAHYGYNEAYGTLTLNNGILNANGVQIGIGALLTGIGSISADAMHPDTIAFLSGIEQDAGLITNAGTLTALGRYVVNVGTLSLLGGVVNASGGVTVEPGVGSQLPILSGYGIINANVLNYGEIDTVLNAPTPLYVYGDYTEFMGVTNIVNGTTLDVFSRANGGGNFTLENGNVFVDSYATLYVTGEYAQFNGNLDASYAAVSVGGDVALSGGTMWLAFGPGLASGGALTVSGATLEVDYTTAGFSGTATIGGDTAPSWLWTAATFSPLRWP